MRAFVGVGSNLGDRWARLALAARALKATPRVALVRASRVWDSAPLGPPQPRYLNAVLELETGLPPRELLAALLVGRRPQIREEAVCLECKRRGYVCVMVATGTPCLGPLTQTGCGALCPAFGRGCYGCFGPREQPHGESLARTFADLTAGPADVARLFAGFTAWTPPFRAIVDQHGGPPGRTPGGPATKEGVGDARR